MTTRALAVLILLGVAPLIPLVMTWRRLIWDASREAPASIARARLEAILTSLSFALLLMGLIWSPILGPDYSKRRLATIYANLVLMVLVAVAAALRTSVTGGKCSRRSALELGIFLGWATG